MSIGGWTYSPSIHPVVVNPALRAKFVESSVRLLEDYGLDGLDVDYEYPSNDAQARGYVDLLRELRIALDKHATDKGADYRFLLTVSTNSFIFLLPRLIFPLHKDCSTLRTRQLPQAPCR